ncbi:glycoside hydrolase family 3 protein [Mucilaginibacter sp. FT3.2]|uniref:glycoside hydrolase family 3 protein n=1 Tax=Mucilaginibacter sp. FT3.2 TaxID=2723090 RepID=UPI00160CCE6D|nr:glycoside hydrolase family 3 N-terminal domain-containing protein [Mucilaginibacter sp. FT3.2]MBB6232258.1 beta-glucosidase-like glycosyl hydrolase [Mucilaginibacter sp. FT3.2]
MPKQKQNICLTIIIALNFIAITAFAQKESYIESLGKQNHWVDSVYNKLSRKHRIAQLLFVRAHTNKGKAYADSVGEVIKHQEIGGLVFFQGGPGRQLNLVNQYQKLSKIPLLIAMDGEWGLGMRLDSTISYPYQMTLGAIQDNTLIYKMGQRVAYDFKRIGAQFNLGPDMDINNNPNNPVINYRSFGDNKYNVAQKGIAYFKGMQDAGLLTSAKHFPGHGDTNVDSHFDLPLLPYSRGRLDSLEEYPFREAIKAGISGVMIAHMSIPALDSTTHLPSTLSRPIITGILKDSLKFKGLVVSDAMEMKGVVKYFPNGEADVRAFIAGIDVLELSENSDRAIKLIRKAVRHGKVSKEEFEAKVKKVLAAKYWAGLNAYKAPSPENLSADINSQTSKDLVQQLSDAAVTVLKGDASTLKLNPFLKTAILSIGVSSPTVLQQEAAKSFGNCKIFMVDKNTQAVELKNILGLLSKYQQVIVGIHDTRLRPQSKLDYSSDVKLMIADLAGRPNTVISVFANAYTIAGLPGIEKSNALMVCYQNSPELQKSVVKVLTGGLKPTGKLPVSVNVFFPTGTGIGLQ